ncbi:MAG: MAPEG family protein [Myxococcales bacterium]|nr:MAPEG family protein [Myxococcales bacterium]MCB9692885.1 MAPEG family protein [Alphaproteobacteria bacterium]
MTLDLWMLLTAAGLQWALIMATAFPQILANGMGWASGNRDETPTPKGWVARCQRCSANMMENLPIFAILVLVAHVSGSADAMTANGAVLFVVARLVHAGLYVGGIPLLRTGAWAFSIVGWALILAGIAT